MDITYVQIAAAVASFLAPFTPYLAKSGMKFAEKVGEESFEKAKSIWEKIMADGGDNPKIEGATLMVSAQPEDEESLAILTKAIAALIKDNHALAKDLLRLVGGEGAIQKVLADHHSWVEDVTQSMNGSGTQVVKASQKSVIKGVKQSKR